MSNTVQKGFIDGQGSQQRETRWLTPKSLVLPLGNFDLDPCGAPGWDLAKKRIFLKMEKTDLGIRGLVGYGAIPHMGAKQSLFLLE